jgi:N-acetylglucosaminyl-diphospho-decaprenol L-rhamnosyltransferase
VASAPTPPGSPDVGVVVVTFRPGEIIGAVLDALVATAPAAIVVVDNSPTVSPDLETAVARHPQVRLLRQPRNLGFCEGNNVGVRALPDTRYLLFLNPDAIVEPSFLADATSTLDAQPDVGAINPKLVTIDPTSFRRTGRIDCTGITQRWYGRFADRGQGETDNGQYDGRIEDVTALCAAAMLCRRAALADVAIDGGVFDESFYMYKEDIDLSLRLRKAGWRLLYLPMLTVGHARGTPASARRQLPPSQRRRSVINEWRIWRKQLLPLRVQVPMLGYLTAKSLLVWIGR